MAQTAQFPPSVPGDQPAKGPSTMITGMTLLPAPVSGPGLGASTEKPMKRPATEQSPTGSSASAKSRKSQSRSLRATTGCNACRNRHMKSDGKRPVCGSCRQSTRTYGSAITAAKPGAPIRTSPSLTSSDSTTEKGEKQNSKDIAPPSPDREAEKVLALKFANFDPVPDDFHEASIQSPKMGSNEIKAVEGVAALSPHSMSPTGMSLDMAPLRWFDLLAGDASASDREFCRSASLPSWISAAALPLPDSETPADKSAVHTRPKDPLFGSAIIDSPDPPKAPWQVAYQVREDELPFFHQYVNRTSLWMDLLDPMRHFSTFVPHLAMANEGVMHAILALGASHMSLNADVGDAKTNRNLAVLHYYKTLHYLGAAMKYETYTRSLELTATALIISMYEMLAESGKGWERHLKGVFWIQRSREIGAESPGLEGAGWWAWLRQDVWAAFRERRRIYSFHRPTKEYSTMTQWDLASRAVYLLAQCVNFSSDPDNREATKDLRKRIARSKELNEMLRVWKTHLTSHFHPLPCSETRESKVFAPVWIHPEPLAVAIQMYQWARILLLIHEPSAGGYSEFLRREQNLREAVDTICGIAMTIHEEASTVVSVQCLYAAGQFLHERNTLKRKAIVALIDEHQTRVGWPVGSLSEELQAEWMAADAKAD